MHYLCRCLCNFERLLLFFLFVEKQYEVTYIRLKFYSPRPESFAIYKRKTDSDPWIPWQFYSASCERTYNLPRRGIITSENEANAICTDEYSDISPLTGGSVPFSTLEGRPSAFEYENSLVLQVKILTLGLYIVCSVVSCIPTNRCMSLFFCPLFFVFSLLFSIFCKPHPDPLKLIRIC